jgi:hypothetical protein
VIHEHVSPGVNSTPATGLLRAAALDTLQPEPRASGLLGVSHRPTEYSDAGRWLSHAEREGGYNGLYINYF